MSRIFVIRHGQASFLKSDYDQLSDLGKKQAFALGQYWKNKGLKVDQIYSGLLKRQQQTAASFMHGMEMEMPVIEHLGFDEHHGPSIVKPFFPDRFYLEKEVPESKFHEFRRFFYGSYFKLAIPWVNEELDPEKIKDIEPWKVFRKRFRQGLSTVLENCPRGANVMIFTSGGPVGGSVGEALDLDDIRTIQLGWQVKNTSFTEFLYGKGKLSLVSFNETPHLADPDLITLV